MCEYIGQLDSQGKAYGYGKALHTEFEYKGTWKDDKLHGFCKFNSF